ncbi:MAG: hypothetical protein KF778_16635 [Rhodocyclaceae bacterium]|nr:hypothetical protein [Rhodocyclaceae bacterium]MBX3670029.1 hypothetical protein [Rhodocyclaceae bacterium]
MSSNSASVGPSLAQRLRGLLETHAASPEFAWYVATISLFTTLTASFPFGVVLAAAVLLNRRRWLRVSLLSSLTAATASLILLLLFGELGWQQVLERYPDLAQSTLYATLQGWLQRWGVWTLFLVTVLPVPQTASMAICAMAYYAPLPAFLALLAGKTVRYVFYGWLAANFPARAYALAQRYGLALERRKRART